MINKIIKPKRADFFAFQDLVVVVIFIIAIIVLFSIANINQNKNQEEIIEFVDGINYPHYVMNIFQNEKIDTTECSGLPAQMTRNEVLIWFDSVKYDKSIEKKDLTKCVAVFERSLRRFNDADLGNNFMLRIIIEIQDWDGDINYIAGKKLDDLFSFSIPGPNHDILIKIEKGSGFHTTGGIL